MSAAIRPLIAGNWKMNGLNAALDELSALARGYDAALKDQTDLLVCPPATLLAAAAATLKGSSVAVGGQDCHVAASGAHTGDISAEMLKDAGASAVILGHSERRVDHGEADAIVEAKVKAAWRAGLLAVVCVGERLEEREAGEAKGVVRRQLRQSLPEGTNPQNVVIAYEPVWAIGTGRTPTPADIAEMHAAMRGLLVERFGAEAAGIRLLYGGSVKPDNAAAILATDNVNGALVGGASLKAQDFLAIARGTA